jgi:hypothetical protein
MMGCKNVKTHCPIVAKIRWEVASRRRGAEQLLLSNTVHHHSLFRT